MALEGEIIPARKVALALPGRVRENGLDLPDDLSFEEWQSLGEQLKGVERHLMWWIGDWLRFGERKWGERYSEALAVTDKSYNTLNGARWVAEKFEIVRRRTNLSWSHHKEVAALPAEAADRLLTVAESHGWSQKELRRHVSQAKASAAISAARPSDETCTEADLSKLIDSGKRFGTLYADPPWLYDNQGTRAATGNHYSGMTVEELCALPIGELMADDAHMHLWTTNGFMFECPRIFDAWGFEFRSSFVWIKPQMGIGNYWRNSHEFLLTAIRGDAKRFNDHSLKSWLECDRSAHSSKPEQVRSYIERASPGPYLELFGRRSAERWTVWGNQIERSIFDASVREVA